MKAARPGLARWNEPRTIKKENGKWKKRKKRNQFAKSFNARHFQ